jgi:hypothetical protein
MKLNHRHWAVRLAGCGWDSQVSLCALFWRCVGRLFLWSLLIGVVITIHVALWQNHGPWALLFFPVVMVVIAIIGGAFWLADGAQHWWYNRPEADNIVIQGFKAVKYRFCPIIEIDHE